MSRRIYYYFECNIVLRARGTGGLMVKTRASCPGVTIDVYRIIMHSIIIISKINGKNSFI